MDNLKYIGKGKSDGIRWGHWLLIGGCAAACGSMVILIGLAFLVPRMLDSVIETYTDARPVPIRVVTLEDYELEELETRIDVFRASMEEGEPGAPLKLSEREINGLFQAEVDDFEGDVEFKFRNDQVIGNLSIPLDRDFKLGPWEKTLSGRYLNGEATFDLSIEQGQVDLTLAKFVVSGKELPDWVLAQVQERVDKQGWLDNENLKEFTRDIERLDIRSGEIVLRAAKR